MNDDAISVSMIVPVFNVAAYLEAGLESIITQDFSQRMEIILVEDCSTDDSREICRLFADRYPDKIELVESAQNGGVSVARNRGLERARGRYLMFVDPDDLLPPDALASLFGAAEQYGADIVKGNLVLFDEHRRRPAPDRVRETRLVRDQQVLTELFEHTAVRGHVGGKLFRRDKFGAIRFTEGVRMAQDLLYFSEIFAAADSLVLIESEVYEYRKHPSGSTGRKYEKGSYIDWLGAVEATGKFAREPRQKRAHKKLLLRTTAQIARECRNIPASSAASVLAMIEQKCREWQLGLPNIVIVDRLGLRGISRYIKLQLALRQIRRNLSRT
jgi:glycosyltransferase involved in cell wall biosynthesis